METTSSFHQWETEGGGDIRNPNAEDDVQVEAAKKEAERYKMVGNALFKEKRFEEANDAYTRAINQCQSVKGRNGVDTYYVYLCNRALTSIKMENFGSAIIDADAAVEQNPTFSKAYYRRGTAYAALGKFPLALKDFQAAYRLKPDVDTQEKIKECSKEIRQMKFAKAIRSGAFDTETSVEPQPAERSKPLSESLRLDALELSAPSSSSYTGPFYKREPSFLKELVDFIRVEGNVLCKRDAYQMVLDMIQLLKPSPTLVDIKVPSSSEFTVCGDIHGQFYDLLHIFELNGYPSDSNPYLFNGDFVDRGSFSVECILTLFAAKLIYPNSVHLARGNHETRNMNKLYGFQGEVSVKYDNTLYELFCECFCYLPLAHTINNRVFIVHGGLFARDGVTLADVASLNRNMEPPDEGIMTELLWSDPKPERGRSPSKRGVACAFGPDVTHRFLRENNLDYVIRSHEMKQNGYDCEHDGKMITVFSAPNYCDQMGNKGAFMRLKGDDLVPRFTTFEAVPHPSVPPMQYANPLFSLFA